MSSMLCVTCPADAASYLAFAPCFSCAVRHLWAPGRAALAIWSFGASLGTRATSTNCTWAGPF
eukprot:1467367-Pyramimonas_sp.AAC.1